MSALARGRLGQAAGAPLRLVKRVEGDDNARMRLLSTEEEARLATTKWRSEMRAQFNATDVDTGERVVIVVVQSRLDTSSRDGDGDALLGLAEYRLADGQRLNVRGELFVTTDGARTFRRD